MTLDQVIALAASVGTCVAAVLALMSLRETAAQRKASYRPELVLKRQVVYATGINGIAMWKNKQDDKTDITQADARYMLKIFNIGLGPAKNLSVQWVFDVKSISNEINRLAEINSSTRHIKEANNHVLAIESTNGILRAMFNISADSKQTFDFVMPYKSDDDGLDVCVPMSYIALTSMYIAEAFAKKGDTKFHDKLLNGIVKISYIDIGGEEHHKQFDMTTRILMYQRTKEEEPNFMASFEQIDPDELSR